MDENVELMKFLELRYNIANDTRISSTKKMIIIAALDLIISIIRNDDINIRNGLDYLVTITTEYFFQNFK